MSIAGYFSNRGNTELRMPKPGDAKSEPLIRFEGPVMNGEKVVKQQQSEAGVLAPRPAGYIWVTSRPCVKNADLSTASILLSTDRSSNTETERCKSSTLTTMRHSSFCARMTPSTPLNGPCAIRTRWPTRRNGQGRTGKVELARVRIVSISSSGRGEGA